MVFYVYKKTHWFLNDWGDIYIIEQLQNIWYKEKFRHEKFENVNHHICD